MIEFDFLQEKEPIKTTQDYLFSGEPRKLEIMNKCSLPERISHLILMSNN